MAHGQPKKKMQTIRDKRDKLMVELDRLDADLKIAKDVIASALVRYDHARHRLRWPVWVVEPFGPAVEFY